MKWENKLAWIYFIYYQRINMKGYDLSFRMWRGDLDAGLPEFNYSNGLIKGIIERCENENITKIKCSLKSLSIL